MPVIDLKWFGSVLSISGMA